MDKIKIALGTLSSQKREYLEEVLKEIGIEADVFPVEVESGVSDQPMTSDEAKQGSINRAKNALKKASDYDKSLGIEIGYHPVEAGPSHQSFAEAGKYEIFCWATIIDRDGLCISQRSHGFMMPEFHQDKLRQGLDLGDHVREYFKLDTDPVTQYVAEMVRGRKPFITEAVKYAFIFYMKKGEF